MGVVMVRFLSVVFGFLLAIAPSLVTAHHGFSGRYDLSTPLWIEGVVVQAYFGRPHATVTLRTPADMALPSPQPDPAIARDVIDVSRLTVRPDTRGRELLIEFPPVSQFFGMDGKLAIGDRISVIAFRNCDAPHQLRGQWILAAGADAQPVARAGRLSYQVERC